jgi:hypothetical protein
MYCNHTNSAVSGVNLIDYFDMVFFLPGFVEGRGRERGEKEERKRRERKRKRRERKRRRKRGEILIKTKECSYCTVIKCSGGKCIIKV